MRLLLVEDDEMLVENLRKTLSQSGFVVDQASTVGVAKSLGVQEDYRVAILDMGLPDGDGLQALRFWREKRQTMPVLILTARSDWQDKVNGLKAGADDYLAKPFHSEELIARIHALIRRTEGRSDGSIQVGGFELDEDRQQVATPDGQWHTLTGTEFRMLRCLMGRPGRLLSKEELVEQLYTIDDEPAHNTIEAYVRRLRRIVGKDAISTQRGQGYTFHA
ncbi:MAG: DNA-binding response regulator [Alteromonadaceae bacterium]|uniref:response regulator n=1 Tax=unclassified Marinobacter TaxID=83889 RepID=UPI000C5AA208|nr:response regulator [Marinobacter sp. BGYM27]MAA64058.1 DNA-binding response regulator [Alteromonadaceae bacterium]MBH85832.1 DNA-binding response regulator [Alteromonadaceae bacterium]MDG5500268.1 response regulator [Marinobacter sp. BGYM27]|tara:strand:+ start:20540 stop:21199 length:660 start_codon:yes stop_codon:yes gene_type:complete